FRAYPADGQSIVAEIADLVRLQGWSTSRLSVEPPRLDEVFRNITRPDTTTTGDNHGGAA
ncbi:MAG: hypothetical protein HOC72_25345, partial [Rhodospirillaceae bacterium]|nr:hypothetical protein [Rhodospirillaceae bacterium]